MINLQHNIVSILYTIKGCVETHMSRFEEERFRDREEALSHAQEIMKRIYAQAERALSVTKKISLAMKASKNGTLPIDRASVKEVWEETAQLLAKRHSLAGFQIIDHIPSDFPNILCGANDLIEILYCLADNAIQAMGEKGKLIIRANLQSLNGNHPLAIITISDTGPGISEELLSRLFEPFVTTKPLEEGNGLGLCLVKSLVKKNEGCVSVSSFKGCGTTFMLTFHVGQPKTRQIDSSAAIAV